MCGIFGIVTTKTRSEIEEVVLQATRALGHRGPDDEGIEFISDERDRLTVAFGHRRLAILDLSPAGHQPMKDEATGNWITYNGEVFNFRDFRPKYESRGCRFRSESDTEVLLKGYGMVGTAAITDWRGMFAFGFWDAGQRRLSLVRDRLGIKPLYYFHDRETFIFASEIRALLATGLVPRRISGPALKSYLSFGSVQQPLTIIDDVYEVLPGHTLTFRDGEILTSPYWELRANDAREERDLHESSDEVADLLLDAVRLRLVSDVPVGVFLSGGIDSSTVVALLRRATGSDIRSFSVCFREEEFSERTYAEKVARHYGTRHSSVLVTGEEILGRLPAALDAMDQPSIDGINTYLVSEATARAGLKVAISGLGGDEVFAGYGFFRTMSRDEQLRAQVRNVPHGLRRAAAAAISTIATGHKAGKLSALLRSDHLDEHSVRLHRQLFTSDQQRELLGDAPCSASPDNGLLEDWMARQMVNCAGADPVNQASALDLGGYLSNTLLRDTDSMSMAHSLEVRVPLIDHILVEKMLSIPGDLKLRESEPKWMLVHAARDLPREIVDRPKRGFELPFSLWLRGSLRGEVEDRLRSSMMTELLNRPSTESIWRGFLTGKVTWSRVWALYVLGEWAERNL